MAVLHELEYFRHRLTEELSRTTRKDLYGGIIQINVEFDNSSNLNQGRDAIDELTRSVTDSVAHMVRMSDVVSVLDDHNIVILIAEAGTTLQEACDRLYELSLRMTEAIKNYSLKQASGVNESTYIGLNVFPDQSGSAETLIQQTGIAVQKSRKQGKDTAVFFQNRLSKHIEKLNEREREIRNAIYSDHFELYFHPCVNQDRTVVGAEAVARWSYDGTEFWRPQDFYNRLRDPSILLEMDTWTIETVCQCINELPDNTLHRLDINLSYEHILKNDLIEVLLAAIQRNNIPTCMIGINLTEQNLSRCLDSQNTLITKLNDLGIDVNIRNLDTTKLPLALLSELKLGSLAVHSSSLESKNKQSKNSSRTEALIGLAKSLNIGVLADNISSEDEYQSLVIAGCDYFQGDHLFESLPFHEFQDLFKAA